MNETDIFDMTEENKPQKVMSKKTKKVLTFLLCAVIGIVVALLAVLIFDAVFSGAPTPEEAISNYQRAALTYNIEDMIEYSSEYNKTVLYGNRETSDKLLRQYLKKGYEGYTTPYELDKINFKLVSVLEYEKGEGRFEEITQLYSEKADIENIKKAAIVRMTVDNGKSDTTRDYLAVKCGMRWYFAYALDTQKA